MRGYGNPQATFGISGDLLEDLLIYFESFPVCKHMQTLYQIREWDLPEIEPLTA